MEAGIALSRDHAWPGSYTIGTFILIPSSQARRWSPSAPIHFLAQDEAVAQEGAQNSVTKGVHFGTHRSRVSVHASHEAVTLAHPAREVRVFKAAWCG
jgi:hypothetical protein